MGAFSGACLVLASILFFGGCSDEEARTGAIGHACLNSSECEPENECFPSRAMGEVCMLRCDANADRLCEGGEVCLDAAGGDICYLGGTLMEGETCAASDECVLGNVCVSQGDGSRCERACDLRDPICPEGESCMALGGEIRGFCQ